MAAAALWLLLFGVLGATSDLIVIPLFIVAPLIVATAADARRTAIFAGAAVVLTIAAGSWHGPVEHGNYWVWPVAVCTVSVPAVVLAGLRHRREECLAQMTAIAKAAQIALLPPVPPEITGISIAARYRSATPKASVGGDLYEIIPTAHGTRVVIGDVRGKGLETVVLARHALSAFRRSAVAVPALERVACEVSRAIRPRLGEEDFVTAVLIQIAPSGELAVVNCGHYPPLLLRGGGLQPLTDTIAALPLGLEDEFTAFTVSWLPGDRLFLYTDGLIESRNHHGDFLPEDQITTALLAADCDQALDTLMTAVDRHTGGHGHDDMALLLLEYVCVPEQQSYGHSRPKSCQDASDSAESPA